MMRKTIMLFGFFLFSISIMLASVSQRHSVVPSNGFVPDEKTAIKIAEAVWIPIYGDKQIQSEKPFVASLKNGVWTVEGSLPKDWDGGVAIAEISKRDGRILRVSHGK
jgi:hypothetical protein